MNNMYLDKEQNPISFEEWVKLFSDKDYRVIRQTKCSDGKFISTVWLGLNHSPETHNPHIFETLVSDPVAIHNNEIKRYSTLSLAIKGHQFYVDKAGGELVDITPQARWSMIYGEIDDSQ